MIVVRERIPEMLAQAGRSREAWLTESERDELSAWRDETRVRQWFAGRWLAKRELRTWTASKLMEIDIASRDSFGRSTAPRVCVRGRAWCGSLSISHAGEHVVVALDSAPGSRVGVDVVSIQGGAWNDGSLATWFSDDEQSWIRAGAEIPRRAARLWASKEAVYKATQCGESFVPRNWPVLVSLADRATSPLQFLELDDAVIAAVCRRRLQTAHHRPR